MRISMDIREDCHEEFRINDPEPILPCSTAYPTGGCGVRADYRLGFSVYYGGKKVGPP
jgi:hypothetical protein